MANFGDRTQRPMPPVISASSCKTLLQEAQTTPLPNVVYTRSLTRYERGWEVLQRGVLSCLRDGNGSRFEARIPSVATTRCRVSAGSITASTDPRSAAM